MIKANVSSINQQFSRSDLQNHREFSDLCKVSTYIKVENVYKYYDDKCVNSNINLEIPQGEIYGLLGPNGAGKTTLLRMLSTITQPDQGTIYLNGEPLTSKHIQLIGYMPEERGLYKKMNVVDQLLFFAELKGFTKQQAKDEVKYWMTKLDILDWANKKMEELSKGMAQKIQFISTILHKPKLLILDEPFSGFDPVNADMVKNLILDLKNSGTTILFSTHRMDNVEELCNKLAIIHKGEKILEGEIHPIRKQFFKHQYIVEFENQPNKEIPYTIIQNQVNHSGNWEVIVQSDNNQPTSEILKYFAQNHDIIGFRENLPTIHQIFVNLVTAQ